MVQQVSIVLEGILAAYTPLLQRIDEAAWSAAQGPGKWQKKEILGHLIDSALNNIQRFIRGQYETQPHIVYHQDEWVSLQHYAQRPGADLLPLWLQLNQQLCTILKYIPEEVYNRECNTGKETPRLHTLAFLAEDYVAHLVHHLEQLIATPAIQQT